MAVMQIVTHPDPVLRARCEAVTLFDPALETLAHDMLDTMYAAPGRGLAAPQVGLPLRIFVIDTDWKDGAPDPKAFVNPEITAASDETVTADEGCLSIPDTPCRVTRPARITLRWQDLDGRGHNAEFDGVAAICIQHELDHLDGVLCIDRHEAAA